MTSTRVGRSIVLVAMACIVIQIGLAIYRSQVQQIQPYWGFAVAGVFLLPLVAELGRRHRYVRLITATFGILFLALGLAVVLWPNPVASLLERISTPLFLFCLGTIMLAGETWIKLRVVCLALFVLSFCGVQSVATLEAHHVKSLREDGVLAHWH